MVNLLDTAERTTPQHRPIEAGGSLRPAEEVSVPVEFTKKEFVKKRIIHPGMKDSEVLNSFRELRTSIIPKLSQFNSVVQVSALRKRCGASFSALNFAVSCAFEENRHALLVDCNLVRPSQARTLDVKADLGLSDFLTNKATNVEDVIYPTGIPRLSLVPSGQTNEDDSIEYFSGERMRQFLEDLKSKHDNRIIILDVPPVLESADAKILAEVADYALLVLPYNGASSSKVQKMLKAAGQEKVVGFVINN